MAIEKSMSLSFLAAGLVACLSMIFGFSDPSAFVSSQNAILLVAVVLLATAVIRNRKNVRVFSANLNFIMLFDLIGLMSVQTLAGFNEHWRVLFFALSLGVSIFLSVWSKRHH